MAIAFYVPDEEELHTGSGANSTTATVQSPPASPINPNEFIQAFYDALYRYSHGVAVVELPHSPSCPTCGSPGPFSPSRSSTPSPLASSPGSPQSETVDRSRRPKRKRLSSIGEEISDEESAGESSSEESIDNAPAGTESCDLDSHLRHMEAREHLELFTGRLPPPKASTSGSKSTSTAPQTRSKTKASST